jgi:hypothetical protein
MWRAKEAESHAMKPNALSLVFFALFTYFAPTFGVEAVVPPPDGGYPNFTTAEGQNALMNLTTGAGNTGVGWYSLFSDTAASFNTGVGAGTLALNTADENTATGTGALLSNTTGTGNTANGAFALVSNSTGDRNTAIGDKALQSNTTGNVNTADGFQALFRNTTGTENTATGYNALANNTIASKNTADGSQALIENTSGEQNTATGYGALSSNTTGIGNTASGVLALTLNTTDSFNTAIGDRALQSHSTGGGNTAIGYSALLNNTTGDDNTAIGTNAGFGLTTGSNNIYINNSGEDESNTIRIGSGHTATFIAGIKGVNEGSPAAVFINTSTGQLGTTPPSSSRRFKKEIKPMDKASEAVLGLKPVTFHYKSDTKGTPQFGLIAEEVAEVNPDLVVRDENGEIYTVRYDAVNAMLLNEFLKEHRKNEEQEKTIAELKSGMTALAATVKEQAAQIQKVSSQLEVNKFAIGRIRRGGPAPRVVVNKP